jgi:uncharacterized protein (TIGR02145 family)
MVSIKISAAQEDVKYKKAIEEALSPMETAGKITLIGEAEENPFEAFEDAKKEVELLVLLLSPEYLNQPELEAKDLQPVLANKAINSKQYWVQPVLLQACDYSDKPYAEYPSFPIPSGANEASPIIGGSWPTEEEAINSIVNSIKLGVSYIQSNKKEATKIETQQKVLVLTSNPKNTQQLNLNQEVMSIKKLLRRSDLRAHYDVELSLDVNKEDLLESLLQEKPAFVHFSGHGLGENGLLFYGEDGKAEKASSEGLANLFRLFSKYIRCVLLNACYSQEQAEVISMHIPYVIGTDNAISDSRAIAFSKGFYAAIFNGENIEAAFDMAVAHVDFQDLPPSAQPVLYQHGQVLKRGGASFSGKQTEPTRGVGEALETEEAKLTEAIVDTTANSWTDPRDQQTYPLVKIGDQIWMGRNFNFELEGSLATEKPEEYGRFYNWEQALAACPEGWRLPSKEDWEQLMATLGGKQEAGHHLKSQEGWLRGENGSNSSGFNAYPAGEFQEHKKDFWNIGYYTHFWSATDLSEEKRYGGDRLAYQVRLTYRDRLLLMNSNYKTNFYCIRYIKNQ